MNTIFSLPLVIYHSVSITTPINVPIIYTQKSGTSGKNGMDNTSLKGVKKLQCERRLQSCGTFQGLRSCYELEKWKTTISTL